MFVVSEKKKEIRNSFHNDCQKTSATHNSHSNSDKENALHFASNIGLVTRLTSVQIPNRLSQDFAVSLKLT